MQELINPCHKCDHHLAGGSKNCDQCRDCEKRIAYVNAIDKCPSSTVNENVELVGKGGAEIVIENLSDSKSIPDKKPIISNLGDKITSDMIELDCKGEKKDLADFETAEEINTNLLKDPIEEHIKEMCQAHGMTVEKFRAGIQGTRDPEKRKKFYEFRDSAIIALASGKFGPLTQYKIGDYIGLNNWSVSKRLVKLGIVKKRTSPLKRAKTKVAEKKETPKNMTIDFTSHPEIYQGLVDTAADQLRTPENQALFILKRVHHWGQIPNDPEIPEPKIKDIWNGKE